MLAGQFNGLSSVIRLATNIEIGTGLQQHAQTASDDAVVISEQNAGSFTQLAPFRAIVILTVHRVSYRARAFATDSVERLGHGLFLVGAIACWAKRQQGMAPPRPSHSWILLLLRNQTVHPVLHSAIADAAIVLTCAVARQFTFHSPGKEGYRGEPAIWMREPLILGASFSLQLEVARADFWAYTARR